MCGVYSTPVFYEDLDRYTVRWPAHAMKFMVRVGLGPGANIPSLMACGC